MAEQILQHTAAAPAAPDFTAERIAASADQTVTWGQGIERAFVYECRGEELRKEPFGDVAGDIKRLYRLVKGQSTVVQLLHAQYYMKGTHKSAAPGVAHQPLPGHVESGLVDLALLLSDEADGLCGNVLFNAIDEDDGKV